MEGHRVLLMITKSTKISHKTLRFMWRIDEKKWKRYEYKPISDRKRFKKIQKEDEKKDLKSKSMT